MWNWAHWDHAGHCWLWTLKGISFKVQWSSAVTPSTAYYLKTLHVQQNEKKTKKLSLHSTSSIAPQISFSISSPKLTKPIELRKRWGLQRRNSFLQGVFQAHLHYTVVLSWDRKSIQNVNLLIMGVYKRQWKHCGVKKTKQKSKTVNVASSLYLHQCPR